MGLTQAITTNYKVNKMKCTICNKPIVLNPAAKDVTGKTAAYYTALFTEHADCTIQKRADDTIKLINRKYPNII